ncbi:caspase-8, partial [Plakobranchus ocellatus]
MDKAKYRELLQDLHSELADDDIKCLKFLAQPLIKKRQYEGIKDGLGFFEALEKCGMLSANNTMFLCQLLETMRRRDLISKITGEDVSWDAVGGDLELVCPFRKMLFDLSLEIPDENLVQMHYLCGNVPKRTPIKDPLDLFMFMIRERCLAPDKLGFLKKVFIDVSRKDLYEKVEAFEGDVHPNECDYRNVLIQTAGPVYQEAPFQSSFTSSHTRGQQLENLKEDPMSHQESGFSMQERMYDIPYQTASIESNPNSSRQPLPDHNMEDSDFQIPDLNSSESSSSSYIPFTADISVGEAAARITAEETGAIRYPVHQLDKSECYKMDAEPRGLCLIIDNQTFMPDHMAECHARNLAYRGGSEVDRDNLRVTFQHLKFRVEEVINATDQKIRDTLMAYAAHDHGAFDCFVLCILSHGVSNAFYGSNGGKVMEHELFDMFSAFNCPTLSTKPKLFFFAYCRGQLHRPDNLRTTFQHLKFRVEELIDVTDRKIRDTLTAYAARDHGAFDCFVLCILSHGVSNAFYGSNGGKVMEQELFDMFSAFNCPTLSTKPKLFFFAYCRGQLHRP